VASALRGSSRSAFELSKGGARLKIYDILTIPLIYRTAQVVLAPGMRRIVTARLRQVLERVPAQNRILDVGCGPSSWLSPLGMQPVGLDVSHPYTVNYRAAGGTCVTASACEMPFGPESFDLVVSVALLHHLPDTLARHAVKEMVRVTRPGGTVVVFDPVLPASAFLRPLPYALCKLDRGNFIRKEADQRARILAPFDWHIQRFSHSYLGTEGLMCTLRRG